MSDKLPRSTSRELIFENGMAIGISNRWVNGQLGKPLRLQRELPPARELLSNVDGSAKSQPGWSC
ncbi:MAG: hypothetical protein ISQ06_11335 [Planctomycetaceae bacterium]|jgi:hypothetical protein|nr:hypothetical protein [Planctomycetaceae bacterium]